MTDTIETRVARGAALLDEKRPGWEREINPFQLDLQLSCNCVLGQLWRDVYCDGDPYDEALAELFPDIDPCEYGFDLGPKYADEASFPALTFEWRKAILARHGGAS